MLSACIMIYILGMRIPDIPPGHFPPVTSATTYYLNVENVSNYIDLGPLSGLGVGVGMGRNRVSKFFFTFK